MRAEIISVGTELLLGSTINTDTADVARLLSEFGINVYWQSVVGDNPGRVSEAVRRAKERADIIITTGGLGPTCDDLTKTALAEAFGLSMELNEGEARWLRELIEGRGRVVQPNDMQQAYLPAGATPLRNDWGTAPGCCFESEGVLVIMLPGPPRECRAMLEHRVRPLLASRRDGVIVSHNIKFIGIGENEMEYRLRDYMNSLSNPSLAPYAKDDECFTRVTAHAASVEEAEEMMRPVIERVLAEFGDLVYGVDNESVAQRVLELLGERSLRLSVAESCTGGELAKRLTDVPGASRSFAGGVTVYTNEAKQILLGLPKALLDEKGAVCAEVAQELAERVRAVLGTELGLGVTGLAGPEGDGVHPVGTVFICLSAPDGSFVRELNVDNRSRDVVRRRACQVALDMTRRYLVGAAVVREDNL